MAKKVDSSRFFRAQRNFDYETSTKHGNASMTVVEWEAKIIDELNSVARSYKKCNVVLIFHDSDRYTTEDQKNNPKHVAGTLKPLHVHFVIQFGDNKKIELVMQKFGVSDKRNIQMATKADVFLSYRYLTHRTLGAMEWGKAAYDTSKLFFIGFDTFSDANNIDNSLTWESSQKISVYTKLCEGKVKQRNDSIDLREIERAMVGQICVSLIDGVIRADSARTRLIDLYKKNVEANKIACAKEDIEAVATHLYYSNKSKFTAAFDDHLKNKAADMIKGDRNLNTGYISGSGGTGKSQLAKAMALTLDDGRIPHMATADGDRTNYDPAGNYAGEKVSIFNEMEGSTLSMREFCNVFDPHQYSPFGSRNSDVDWVANYSIITESDSFVQWIDDKLRFGKGGSKYASDLNRYNKDYYQVARRFKYHIQLIKSGQYGCDVVVYEFDSSSSNKMPFKPINAQPYHCDDVRSIENMLPIATAITHDLNLVADSQIQKNADAVKKTAKFLDESESKKTNKQLSDEEKSYLADPSNLF